MNETKTHVVVIKPGLRVTSLLKYAISQRCTRRINC